MQADFFGWMQLSDLLAVRTSCTVGGESFVGGLAGFTWSNTVTRSSAHGDVTANVDEAGGLFGRTNEESVFQSWGDRRRLGRQPAWVDSLAK